MSVTEGIVSKVVVENQVPDTVELYPLQPQPILQWWQDVTRMMVIEPSELAPFLPARAAPFLHRRLVDLQVLFDHACDQLPEPRCAQYRGLDFFPAASPDSGTTRPSAPGSGDDARQSSSAPDSPPDQPPPWLV